MTRRVVTRRAAHVAPHVDAWLGGSFEDLAREALPLLYLQEGVTAGFEIGEFWAKDVQIDVVGLRRDGWTDLGECRWTAATPSEVVGELRRRAGAYPNARGATLGLRVFTRQAAPREVPEGVRWYDLAALYGEP